MLGKLFVDGSRVCASRFFGPLVLIGRPATIVSYVYLRHLSCPATQDQDEILESKSLFCKMIRSFEAVLAKTAILSVNCNFPEDDRMRRPCANRVQP